MGDVVLAAGHGIAGYIDGDPDKVGQVVDTIGAPICWQEDAFLAYVLQTGYPEDVDACALGIGDNRLRQRRLAALEGLEVPPVIHPSATISPNARIGRGSVVFANAVVNAGAWIDEAVIVNSGAIIEHDCRLEAGVHISPGAVLCGGVRIGARSWVGAGATVIHGRTIGSDAVVGAGSTVIADVGDSEKVVGSPARPSRNRE